MQSSGRVLTEGRKRQVLLDPMNLPRDRCGNPADPSDVVNRGVGWKDE